MILIQVKAKIVKMIIVKEGGTKMVEIILANLSGLSMNSIFLPHC